MRTEHAPASDLVERAIFSYERALAPGPARFAIGRDRLDFRLAENRPLFLALGRHVVYVTFIPSCAAHPSTETSFAAV